MQKDAVRKVVDWDKLKEVVKGVQEGGVNEEDKWYNDLLGNTNSNTYTPNTLRHLGKGNGPRGGGTTKSQHNVRLSGRQGEEEKVQGSGKGRVSAEEYRHERLKQHG